MQIKVNKTTFKVMDIDHMESGDRKYTNYHLKNKNTVKVLVHNTTWDQFTLWGKISGRSTMTTPARENVTFI